jgi:phosphoglucosamine mutase
MKKKLFGTDGIRGRVGEPPMTPDFILKLGRAAGEALIETTKNNKIIIGKDTRISGYMFESALEAGLSAAGAETYLLGPMPTPAIAYLTRTLRAAAGIVISASHNPYHDNGIKFFSSEGKKLPPSLEELIEQKLEISQFNAIELYVGKAHRVDDAAGRYIEYCKSTIPGKTRLVGLKLVIDCANGSTYSIAPRVFSELGADVVAICNAPNGININEKCGTTDTTLLAETVIKEKADLGIAIDGDGDRLIMIDDQGNVVDGDELLYVLASGYQEINLLNGGVVGTEMSNLGLERAFSKRDIDFKRTKVGDKYIHELLQKLGWRLGGEPSGHILCLDRATTGDAIVVALQVLSEILRTEKNLCELKDPIKKLPQIIINVPLHLENNILKSQKVQQAVRDAENILSERGRVLLRNSGTEPIVRVMVEGEDSTQVKELADMLATAVKELSQQQLH